MFFSHQSAGTRVHPVRKVAFFPVDVAVQFMKQFKKYDLRAF
jgi:hypothetical protein